MSNYYNVFFTGAGFSKAIIPSFPLLHDLSHLITSFYGNNSIAKHFYNEIPYLYKKNIEHLLTFLSSNLPFKTDIQLSIDDALYKDLKNKITLYFERKINYAVTLSPQLKTLCSYFLTYKTPTISLNYDLLLEKIFTEYFKENNKHAVNFEYFYKAPITSLRARQIPKAFGFGNNTWVSKNDYPIILKLHGSINWLCASISQTDPVYCKEIPFDNDDKYLIKDLQTMIVPPVMDKTSIYNHTILKTIWRQAYEKLQEANEIYICGFSFPETDLSIRFLFQSALKNNTNLEKIYFINTGNNLEEKKKHFTKAIAGEQYIKCNGNQIYYNHITLDFTYCCENSLNKFIDEVIAPRI